MHRALASVSLLLASKLFASDIQDVKCTKSHSNINVLSVTYDENSSKLDDESTERLRSVGRQLKDAGHQIVVEGHSTDGGRDSRTLSALRASSVVGILQQELAYPSDRISAAAYADSNGSRRVDLKIKCDLL